MPLATTYVFQEVKGTGRTVITEEAKKTIWFYFLKSQPLKRLFLFCFCILDCSLTLGNRNLWME